MNHQDYLKIYFNNLFVSRKLPSWVRAKVAINHIATMNLENKPGIAITFNFELSKDADFSSSDSRIFVTPELQHKSLNYWKRQLSANVAVNESISVEELNFFYDFCSRYVLLSCYTGLASDTELGIVLEAS